MSELSTVARNSSDVSMKNTEKWLPVVGFEGLYEVSNWGRIRSIKARQGAKLRIQEGWVKRHERGGYPVSVQVAFRKNGKTHERRLHRVVLEAFVSPCPDGMEGCHGDGNPLNNRVENLRWDTHKANIADCIRHGRKSRPPVHLGDAHHNTRLSARDVLAIRATPLVRGAKARLAREYGISQTSVMRILRREVWGHV